VEEAHRRSITAVTTEAGQVGVVPDRVARDEEEIPGQERKVRAGDPDVSGIEAGHVGESTPGGSTPTPDQSNVDEIGRAVGVEEADRRELRTSREVLEERDRRRSEEEPRNEG
jgi:hypothetical protein